jgi:putative heme-binding domain-containing protein
MVRLFFILFAVLLAGPSGNVADSSPAPDAARKAINLEALSRLKGLDLEANPALKTVVFKLLDQSRGTPQFVDIVRDFNLKGQEAGLLEIAANDPSGPAGIEATRLVLRRGDKILLKQSLDSTNALNLIEALGNTGDKEIVSLLQPLLLDTGRPVAVRQQTVRAMAKVQEGAAALIELARTKKLPDDLRSGAGFELRTVRWKDLQTEAGQWLPVPPSAQTHVLPPISELIKMKGDPAKGAAVFRRDTVACFKCHQINGQGTDFGPNLSEIGTKLARNALYESILDPSAGIAFGYEAWQLDFANGDDAFGLIMSQTDDEVVLKAVGGVVTRYKKANIVKCVRQKLSIMPAGLEQTMSLQDLVDLVEYLASLKKAES